MCANLELINPVLLGLEREASDRNLGWFSDKDGLSTPTRASIQLKSGFLTHTQADTGC